MSWARRQRGSSFSRPVQARSLKGFDSTGGKQWTRGKRRLSWGLLPIALEVRLLVAFAVETYPVPMHQKLYQLGPIALKNRIVMAPMTRCRAIGNTPNSLMAEYYTQRAGAGLIVTEGTAPSKNGLGYARIPGLFSEEQVDGWRGVTNAVHKAGGRIVVQLMHTGRVSHLSNMPDGAEVLGPSIEICPGEMYTDGAGPQKHSAPRVMNEADIQQAIEEFVSASKNALRAGFDGVELHAANGYLIEQFLNANVNRRHDNYGGSIENRNRFAVAVAKATSAAIGADRVGIRLSPHGAFNGTGGYADVDAQYLALTNELSKIGLLYVHLVDHSSMGAPTVPDELKQAIRKAFGGSLILSGGFAHDTADAALLASKGDLVALARPFLANPDLLVRWEKGAELNAPDPATFYTPGPKGYTDYPTLG